MDNTPSQQACTTRLPLKSAFLHAAEALETYNADPSAVTVGRARPGISVGLSWKAGRSDEYYNTVANAVHHMGGYTTYFKDSGLADAFTSLWPTLEFDVETVAMADLTVPSHIWERIEKSEKRGVHVCLYYP